MLKHTMDSLVKVEKGAVEKRWSWAELASRQRCRAAEMLMLSLAGLHIHLTCLQACISLKAHMAAFLHVACYACACT